MNSYIEFFISQEDAIKKYCTEKDKKKSAELVGRLYGSVSIARYHRHITQEEFNEWDKKIKFYQSLYVQ